jgi:hypothetical protein
LILGPIPLESHRWQTQSLRAKIIRDESQEQKSKCQESRLKKCKLSGIESSSPGTGPLEVARFLYERFISKKRKNTRKPEKERDRE